MIKSGCPTVQSVIIYSLNFCLHCISLFLQSSLWVMVCPVATVLLLLMFYNRSVFPSNSRLLLLRDRFLCDVYTRKNGLNCRFGKMSAYSSLFFLWRWEHSFLSGLAIRLVCLVIPQDRYLCIHPCYKMLSLYKIK